MSENPILFSFAIGLPPEQAIKYFQARVTRSLLGLDEMWQDAHAKAFTVAKMTKLDLLQDIRGAVDGRLPAASRWISFWSVGGS